MAQARSGLCAVVVMGVSGAGKSTVGKLVAEGIDCPFRDADSFHPPANIAKMSRGAALTDADRWPWLRAIADWIAQHRAAGTTGVVTCSALKRAYRDIVTNHQSPDARLVYLKGDFDLIMARLKSRQGHFMPPALLKSQFDALEEPSAEENAIVVSVARTPAEIAASIMRQIMSEGRRDRMAYKALTDPEFERLVTLRNAYRIMERFLSDYLDRGDTSVSDFLHVYAGKTRAGQSADPAALSDFLAAADRVLDT
jgi:carbohydrate kinase (thermoresistant glucokinase family)